MKYGNVTLTLTKTLATADSTECTTEKPSSRQEMYVFVQFSYFASNCSCFFLTFKRNSDRLPAKITDRVENVSVAAKIYEHVIGVKFSSYVLTPETCLVRLPICRKSITNVSTLK